MRGSKFSLDFKFSLLSFLSRMLLSSFYFLKKVKYFTCQSLNRHMEFFPKEFWLSSSAVDMGLWLYLSLIDQSTISAFFHFSLFQVQPLSLTHTHTYIVPSYPFSVLFRIKWMGPIHIWWWPKSSVSRMDLYCFELLFYMSSKEYSAYCEFHLMLQVCFGICSHDHRLCCACICLSWSLSGFLLEVNTAVAVE